MANVNTRFNISADMVAGGGTPAVSAEESRVGYTGAPNAIRFDTPEVETKEPAQYAGQGFNYFAEASPEVVANATMMSPMSQEREQPQTQAAAQPAATAAQPQEQVADQARVASGMAQPTQQQTPQQAEQPQVQQQPTAPAEPGVPMLAMPTEQLPMESERQWTETFDEARDANMMDLVGNAERLTMMRESSQLDQPTPQSRQGQARSRRYARGNSAEYAVEYEDQRAATAERTNKPWWTAPADRMIRFSQGMQLRPKAVIDAAKNRAARAFKKLGVGNRVYGKMLGLSTLGFQDIGLGLQEIMAVIRQDPTMLETLVAANVKEVPSFGMMSSSEIVKFFEDNEIWVATFKPPNNQGQDIQRRRLRILTQQQRGIYLHNVMAAMYTADYDGDDMEVSFDPNVARNAKDPMDYMVDIYGKISLNTDFMPVAEIVPVRDENGNVTMDEWTYVRDVMLGSFTSNVDKRTVEPLVRAILELGKTANKGDDAQAKAYGKVFREARKFTDKLSRGARASNAAMSDVCRAVFDSMQRTKYYNTLTVVGGDILTLDEDAVPEPVTYGDAIAYKLIDGMVKGSIPNNFQELKLLLTGFTGNVKGKNAPFRFTADVGKMMKMDDRLRVGDHYELKVDDDMQMELFFKTTCKFAGSLKMAREIKKAGRSQYYTQVMRELVIREVCFPENYNTFQEFLMKFVESYNIHSATINEANAVFLTNMGMSSEPNGVVSALKKSGGNDYTLSDLAEPMLSIYGTYSVGKIFKGLITKDRMGRDKRDPFFSGNPNARKQARSYEREYDRQYDERGFWITGKYIDYSLRQFKNENHFVRGDSKETDEIRVARARKLGDLDKNERSFDMDVDAQFEMMLAIADKRTGAASKFNNVTFGMMEKEHQSHETTTVRYMSTLLTSVSNALREGNEVITPGFYAGIGNSKDVPKSVLARMTSVAKRLNNMNFTLRSGDTEGSDQAFQMGAGNNMCVYKASSKDEVSKFAKNVVSLEDMDMFEQKAAYDSVERLRVNNRYIRSQLARGYFQIVGTGGSVDSAFVVCYADQNDSEVWQTIRLARERGIPVFNAAEYGADLDRWENDVIDAATKANMGELRTESVGRSQALEVQEAISALIMANPDLFMHFNMDSPAAFLESAYGRKMLQYADNLEMLGGIYTSMVFDYRMERITSLTSELMTQSSTQRLEEVWNDLLFAKDELAASSSIWRGIIMEFEAEATNGVKSFFNMMDEGKVMSYGKYDGVKPWKWDAKKDAEDFWRDRRDHNTLRSVITDLNMDRATKWNVIVDVARYWNNDPYLKSYEVGYQMEIGNDATYSFGEAPAKGALTVHREFEQAFNRWGRRSQALLRTDVEQARAGYASVPNALTDTIRRLDQEPWELVSIDSLMYADAILSVYDKTYAQTEKASQNPWTNAIYAALSLQQTGGYMNDVTRVDDRLLGLTSVDSVTVQDVIHLLANPNEDMVVYGKRGEWGIISRDILLKNELGELSGNIEADMWEFLTREPRIASAIRKHSACVLQDSDGTGYLGASNSIAETIEDLSENGTDPLAQTRYLMRDHPGYAGIISLALPGKNLITRNARHRIKKIEDFLSYELYAAASSDWEAPDIAEIVLEDLGITRDALRSAMRSDYDTFLERQGLDAYKYTVTDKEGNEVLESEYDADLTYEYAHECVTKYINELRDKDNGVVLGTYIEAPSTPNFGDKITSFHDSNDDPIFLSNMYEVPVTYKGITYGSSEAAFQAQKCVNEKDRLKFVNISPQAAKSLGKTVKLRDNWDAIKVDIMREIIHAKFSNPEMRRLLDETGSAELIEGNTWKDREWGVYNGVGKNLLGKILMEERGTPPTGIGPDAISAAAFWDTIQELSGAKTSVSTGIEGSETYKFAEWVSHIQARDGYADLQAILDNQKFTPEWNGMWTNVPAPDGGYMTLEVDTRGVVANAETIERIAREQNITEIVVEVPEGVTVSDRSTDTHGTQVQSLFALMVSKRSNGAEAFNLKAKKAGIDGKDSITKKLRGGKSKVDENGQRVNFLDLTLRFQQLARQADGTNDLRAAQMELARMMREENHELGYDDLTMANYMSIAQLMLIEGEDGKVHLRSLEMLISAIKYRIGWKIDEVDDDQLFRAVDAIVNDRTETGVGIAMMESLEALDGFSPRSRAMQYNAMRQTSSVFSRNYDLLSKITERAKSKGVKPLTISEAESLDTKLAFPICELLDGLNEDKGYRSRKLMNLLKGYKIVSAIGIGNDSEINNTIGPSNVTYIGPIAKEEEIVKACKRAYSWGMTVVCDNTVRDSLPDFFKKDAVPMLDEEGEDVGAVLIPCFDMRLNGSEARPFKGRFAIAQVPFSQYVASAEDSTNEFGLGDAEGQALRHLTDNMSMVQTDTTKITAESLFPNVFKNPDYRDCRIRVGLANGETLRNNIADGVRCTIDYGVVEGGKGFDQRVKDVDDAIERYRARWTLCNPDGMMMGLDDCEPGDIVGWAEAEIGYPDGSFQYVIAPIIPFPLHGVKRQPSRYSVENLGPVDNDNTLFTVDWKNTTELTDEFVKYFDSSGGANKGMINLSQALDESRTLLDGTPLDVYIAKASTDSRKVGTDRRIKTMITLMTLARMHGYNFARKPDGTPNEDAFPDNPELRKELLHGRIPIDKWRQLLDSNVRFVTDDTLNAFITYECVKVMENGGNPSDYLANVYENEDGELENTHVMWEFEAMFDQGLNYEDGLLRFLAFVNPITPNEHVQQFCPNGIEDKTTTALFRLYQEGGEIAQGYDRGVLQMRVPHRLENKVAYVWDNVYIGMSFFGEEYSGFSRPNVDGASNFLDGMNTMSMYGKTMSGSSARDRAKWATSDIGRYPHGNGSFERT